MSKVALRWRLHAGSWLNLPYSSKLHGVTHTNMHIALATPKGIEHGRTPQVVWDLVCTLFACCVQLKFEPAFRELMSMGKQQISHGVWLRRPIVYLELEPTFSELQLPEVTVGLLQLTAQLQSWRCQQLPLPLP